MINKVIYSEPAGTDISCGTCWSGSLSPSIGFDKVKLKIHVVKKNINIATTMEFEPTTT